MHTWLQSILSNRKQSQKLYQAEKVRPNKQMSPITIEIMILNLASKCLARSFIPGPPPPSPSSFGIKAIIDYLSLFSLFMLLHYLLYYKEYIYCTIKEMAINVGRVSYQICRSRRRTPAAPAPGSSCWRNCRPGRSRSRARQRASSCLGEEYYQYSLYKLYMEGE